MGRIKTERWLALAELATVFAGTLLLFLRPQLGVWPLLLVLVIWIGWVAADRFANLATPLNLPLFIFLATAALGIWAAYNRADSLDKFWLIAAACLLYYALARQPGENLWLVAAAISVCLAILAAYFLLAAAPVPVPTTLIPESGQTPAAQVGPSLADLLHDTGEGLIAILSPFAIALGIYAWKRRRPAAGIVSLAALLLAAAALWQGSSLAAALALASALALTGAWLATSYLPGWSVQGRIALLAAGVLAVVALGLTIAVLQPDWLAAQTNRLAGSGRAGSQIQVNLNTLHLIPDFLFTGGGLAAFPGLYSQYILNLPFYMFGYSYSLYLDLAVEQGILGLAAYLALLAGSFFLVVTSKAHAALRWAVLASLWVLAVNGLADDPLYGGRGTPLLFLLPGLAVACARYLPRGQLQPAAGGQTRRLRLGTMALLITIALSCLGYKLVSTRLGAWYANLGAVQMAQVELADFPSGEWEDGSILPALAPAEDLFNQALQREADNFTASYRLGMTAMYRRDFPLAQAHLESAHAVDPPHRGVRKTLGYCYVWLGLFDQAEQMLQDIPEAPHELEAYTWWWQTQGRSDLSANAAQMADLLKQ